MFLIRTIKSKKLKIIAEELIYAMKDFQKLDP